MAEEVKKEVQPQSIVKDEKPDFTDLEKKMESLTAADFTQTERECRMVGDMTPDIVQSMDFSARLAGRAVGVPYSQIKDLPIRDFFSIANRAKNFLLRPLVEKAIQQGN